MGSLSEKFTLEKNLVYILIFAVLAAFAFIFYLFFGQFTKSIKIISPTGGEEWQLAQTYKISWEAKRIGKVGIVLFKGQEPKWIAKNIPAGAGSYEWKIYPGQAYGDDYWIAVFEYPWQKGNRIAYSEGAFAVVYPELGSCDTLSIQNEWSYVPSDLPDSRQVFITEDTYKGNLEGLEGADRKCQEEAEKQGFFGTWYAFLGGDSPEELATERLKTTPRKTDGVFVEAKPAATLIRGATCHRLLGKDLNEFLAKFSGLLIINEEKFEDSFSQKLKEVWIGRLNEGSKENCISIALTLENPYKPLAEKYSFSSTCQNWTKEDIFVEGYPASSGQPNPPFGTCYTVAGKQTGAVALGGLAIGLTGGGVSTNAFTPYQGKSCDTAQRLICIEE